MDSYKIAVMPEAEADLTELRNYITEALLAPDTALAYVRSVRKEIGTLSEMPARYQLVDEEPERSSGVRRLIVKNFYVYYQIDEGAKRVYILNVIYTRRDQLKALSDKNTD